MSVAKPGTVPRWASASPSTSTVTPPANTAAITNWAAGAVTPGLLVMRTGVEYVVISIAGAGTSTTGPTGTGVTVDNPGANQVTWGYVSTVPTTQDSGFQPNTQPPAQYFNWLFYWIYLWILWIQDIANQDFSGSGSPANGPWTGLHLFTGGVGTTAPIVVTAGVSTSGGQVPGINSTGSINPSGNPGTGLIGNGGIPTGANGGNGVEGNGSGTGYGGAFQGGTSGTTSGGNGIQAIGGPSSAGGSFQGGVVPSGGGSAGPGLTCTGGSDGTSNGQPGAICNGGLGNAVGCQGNGTGTAAGVVGIATTATSGAGAVTGVNFGAGPGVYGASTTGPGVLGQSSSAGAAIQGVSSLGTPCGQFFNTYSGGGIGITCTTLTGIAGFFENTGDGGTATQATSNSGTTATSMVANTGTGAAIQATSKGDAQPTITAQNTGDGDVVTASAAGSGSALKAAVSQILGTCIDIVKGLLTFSGTQPASTDVVPVNSFSAAHFSKCWGVIALDGAGGATVVDGINIASVSVSGSSVSVVFATPMGGTRYAVTGHYLQGVPGTYTGTGYVISAAHTPLVGTVALEVPNGFGAISTNLYNLATSAGTLVFDLKCRQ